MSPQLSRDSNSDLLGGSSFLCPQFPLQTRPTYKVPIHTDALTRSQGEVTSSRRHARYSSSLVLKPFAETILCPLFKAACGLQTPSPSRREDRPQTRGTPSRLFPITRGRGSVPRCRHFLRRPLLQNAPFDKPGCANTGRGRWEPRALLAPPFIQFTLIRPTLANESVLFPSVCASGSREQFGRIGFPRGNAGISMI